MGPTDKRIWVTWSGGVDSTLLLEMLMKKGFEVFPITVLFGPKNRQENERRARTVIANYFRARYPEKWNDAMVHSGDFVERMSLGALYSEDIPKRNKMIMDFVMSVYVIQNKGYYLGMGLHLITDTRLADTPYPRFDDDPRHMSSYLLSEYGDRFQLVTLNDFDFLARHRIDTFKLFVENVKSTQWFTPYCCISPDDPKNSHCGRCYKCVERYAAFSAILGHDHTHYEYDPRTSSMLTTIRKSFVAARRIRISLEEQAHAD